MTIKTIAAMAALAMGFGAAGAGAQEGPPPPGALPPGVMAQINLGQAGLLGAYYSNEQWGTTQGRVGLSRSTVGIAGGGGPVTGYEDASTDAVLSFNGLRALPDGKSYLRFGATLAMPDGAENQVEQDATNPSVIVQYMTFPNPDTMLAFGAFAERFDVEESGVLPSTVVRDGYGLRADLLRKLSDSWGLAARAEYSWGETELNIPAIPLEQTQGDDRFYAQAELIGTLPGAAPEGWVLRPVVGANFQRNFWEISGPSGATEEDYGMVWAGLGIEQQVPPGTWGFNASLGLEHEYVNDLDTYVDEPTYAAASVGAALQLPSGNRITLGYTRHQGLNGNRWSQTLLAAMSVNF